MKKTSTFMLAALALAVCSCNADGTTATGGAVAQGEAGEALAIRYVYRDSIAKNYIFAEATRQANERLEAELYAYGNQLQGMVQNLQSQFQQKLQNNQFLSEQTAQNEYNKIQQQAAGYDKQYSQRQAETLTKAQANSQALLDSINNFVADFIAKKHYDAILYREDNLYINPALDVTDEVVAGLNARYEAPVATPAEDKKK